VSLKLKKTEARLKILLAFDSMQFLDGSKIN
jgi:hypothetical protein